MNDEAHQEVCYPYQEAETDIVIDKILSDVYIVDVAIGNLVALKDFHYIEIGSGFFSVLPPDSQDSQTVGAS